MTQKTNATSRSTRTRKRERSLAHSAAIATLAWASFTSIGRALPATRPANESGATAPANPTSMELRIAGFIDALGDPSSKRRDQAVIQLRKAGRPAREALVKATHSPSAQRRQLAKLVLAQLPLFRKDDPAELVDALQTYQRTAAVDRPAQAARLLTTRTPTSDAAIARILREDANDDVLWTIVTTATPTDRERLMHGPLADLATQADADATEPALRFLRGSVAESSAARLEEFRRCLDETSIAPASAAPAIARVANALCAQARIDKDAAAEIGVRRRVALLLANTPTAPQPSNTAVDASGTKVTRLAPAIESYLVTRVRLRNGDGIETDLESLGVPTTHPIVKLMRALIASKGPAPTTAPVEPTPLAPDIAAIVDLFASDDVPDVLTLLCSAEEWPLVDQISARELTKLDRAGAGDWAAEYRRVRLALTRYTLARARADTKAAAESLRLALAAMPEEGRTLTRQRADGTPFSVTPGDLFAELYVEDVRRGMRADDKTATDVALDALARVTITDATIAIDAVYVLESNGRVKEADEIASEYLANVKSQLDADEARQDPDGDNIALLNSVAWFSARTGRNLTQAYDYAKRATDKAPDSPGLMDTLAEASFRTNRVKEAVALETKALDLDRQQGGGTNDPFMTRQLARFSAGLQDGDAERAMPSEDWKD